MSSPTTLPQTPLDPHPTPTPISISIPSSLHHLTIPLSKFLSANPRYTNLVVGACIFAPQNPILTHFNPISLQSTPLPHSILLIQRAASEHAFPNLWEIPGGSSETTDPTVLHSLAREVFEETGLRLTRVVRQIGDGVEFTSTRGGGEGGEVVVEKVWLKLTFEIHVAEIDSLGLGLGLDPLAPKDVLRVPITLDPSEHQAYAWVTEENVRAVEGKGEGNPHHQHQHPLQHKFPTISETQREVILQAFALKSQSL